MVKEKMTVSLSNKCLELIDTYAETTGLESRSRVIEEAIFSICDLLNDESKLAAVLHHFRRFPIENKSPEKPTVEYNGKKYCKVSPENRKS